LEATVKKILAQGEEFTRFDLISVMEGQLLLEIAWLISFPR